MAKNITLRVLKIIGIILAVILALYAILTAIRYISLSEFYSTAESRINMPGLSDGFIPQGLDSYNEGFLMSGYMQDKSASRLYYVDENGRADRIDLKKANGDDFTGHAGGVAHRGDYIYVGGSKGLYVFGLQDAFDGDGIAKQVGFFPVGLNAAWVQVEGDYIYCGSFWNEPDYKTDEWQHITTPSGDRNNSMILAFELDSTAELGIKTGAKAAFSTEWRVQGAILTEDYAVLSTSLGFNTSVFYFHKIDYTYSGTVKVGGEGEEIPLYYLDSKTLTYKVNSIPMAEEIVLVGDRIYIANESASTKFILGNFNEGYKFYSFKLKDEYIGK